MIRFCHALLICAVLFSAIGCRKREEATAEKAPPKQLASKKTPAEKLTCMLPDDVFAFAATSGGESLKPAFEKSILGRMWHDPELKNFYQSIKKQLLVKAKLQVQDPNKAQALDIVLDFIRLAANRPIIIGAAQKQDHEASPVFGFAIIDAAEQKTEIAAALAKLEALADEGDIVEINVGSVKMHGPKDANEAPVCWGWVQNYLVFAVNDQRGLAIKNLREPRTTAPDYLNKVPAADDALIMYVDCQRVAGAIKTVADQKQATEQYTKAAAVIKQLGQNNVKRLTARMGFAGPDLVSNELLEVPQPRTGLLASLKTINLSSLDAVDARAVNATAINFDMAGLYDTVLTAIKVAAPNDVYTDIQQTIAEFEAQAKFNLRQGLLESLAGPILVYSLPAGVLMEAPNGGPVAIAELKDAQLFEKSAAALGKFAAAKSNGMLQVSSQVQTDGKTRHLWMIPPLAMMQISPCWAVTDNRVVIASNPALYDTALKQTASAEAAATSIRTTEGYKKIAANLPDNLISLRYTDSKVQFKQMMLQIQQFWPIVTMAAAKADVNLPPMLPLLDDVVEDIGPSCQYSWFDADGLRSQYQGSGTEASLGAVAGASLGVGIMMPALARVREISKRMVSGTNLSGIGKALLIYANDHDDQFPPNLQELIEKCDVLPKSLESPRKPKGFDGPSYIYIPGQNTSMDPGNIIAYENPAFDTKMINVLFLDSHVKVMKPDAFLRELEATYKRLGREMPEIKFKGSRRPGRGPVPQRR